MLYRGWARFVAGGHWKINVITSWLCWIQASQRDNKRVSVQGNPPFSSMPEHLTRSRQPQRNCPYRNGGAARIWALPGWTTCRPHTTVCCAVRVVISSYRRLGFAKMPMIMSKWELNPTQRAQLCVLLTWNMERWLPNRKMGSEVQHKYKRQAPSCFPAQCVVAHELGTDNRRRQASKKPWWKYLEAVMA